MTALLKDIPKVLKFDDWPLQDQDALEALFVGGSLFGPGGACEFWADGTRRLRQQGYGQWLSFIMRTHPGLVGAQPHERITRELVESYIEESKARLKIRSVSNLVISLAALAQAMAPQCDWQWLWRAGHRLYKQSNPNALKPRIPLSASDVFQWSLSQLNQVENDPDLDELERAMRFRQALMVGLLITRPVRARAFSGMKVGCHLHIDSEGSELRFYREDMKDKRSRIYPLPNQLSVPMRRYLAVHHPVLLGGSESDALWISQRGNPFSQDSFTAGLAKLTKRHFGVALRPHAFRHIAATSIAEVDPCHVGIIRDILGHATMDMAERTYNRAGTITASNKMQSLVYEIRREHQKAHRSS